MKASIARSNTETAINAYKTTTLEDILKQVDKSSKDGFFDIYYTIDMRDASVPDTLNQLTDLGYEILKPTPFGHKKNFLISWR